MAKEKINAKIVRQEQIGSDIYSMVLKVGELAKDVVAGQFIKKNSIFIRKYERS